MIPEFITYLRSIRGYSPNTVRSYEKDLRDFSLWISTYYPGIRWSTITRHHIDAYITALEKAGRKPSTTNRHLSAISSLYGYMRREGNEVANPCKYESRRKIAETIPPTIPVNIMQQAFSEARGEIKALLGILIFTGCRIQEALDLRWMDINFSEDLITFTGKGNKQRTIHAIVSSLEKELLYIKRGGEADRVFHIGQREARYKIWQAFAAHGRVYYSSPHIIRHSVATIMAQNGESAYTIAQVLGHKDIKTSQKYVDIAQVRGSHALMNINKQFNLQFNYD